MFCAAFRSFVVGGKRFSSGTRSLLISRSKYAVLDQNHSIFQVERSILVLSCISGYNLRHSAHFIELTNMSPRGKAKAKVKNTARVPAPGGRLNESLRLCSDILFVPLLTSSHDSHFHFHSNKLSFHHTCKSLILAQLFSCPTDQHVVTHFHVHLEIFFRFQSIFFCCFDLSCLFCFLSSIPSLKMTLSTAMLLFVL